MTTRPPMHVLTAPEAWGLTALAPSGGRSSSGIAIFGEYVRTHDGRVMIFAGCDDSGEPTLVEEKDRPKLEGIRFRIEGARDRHDSGELHARCR